MSPVTILAGVVIALLSGCTGEIKPKGDESVINVETDTVSVSDEVGRLEYVGIIEEKSSVALGFSVLGTIESISVSEGEIVRKGQLLAKLDNSTARSVLEAAEATLKQAQDGYERLKSIYEKGSLPEIQMVDIETKLHQAQSSYDLAEKNLKDCSLYSPADGVVGKKLAEAGEYTVPGKGILTILDISTVKVRFSVPENEISKIQSDCVSEITVAALGNRKFTGTKLEKTVMANSVSHSYPAHVILNNSGRELLPGMVCNIEIIMPDHTSRIVVPVVIVQNTPDGRKFVWIDSEGIAKRSFITTGSVKGNGIEILEGLSAGDRVITGGYQKIGEGDKISVK